MGKALKSLGHEVDEKIGYDGMKGVDGSIPRGETSREINPRSFSDSAVCVLRGKGEGIYC